MPNESVECRTQGRLQECLLLGKPTAKGGGDFRESGIVRFCCRSTLLYVLTKPL